MTENFFRSIFFIVFVLPLVSCNKPVGQPPSPTNQPCQCQFIMRTLPNNPTYLELPAPEIEWRGVLKKEVVEPPPNRIGWTYVLETETKKIPLAYGLQDLQNFENQQVTIMGKLDDVIERTGLAGPPELLWVNTITILCN